MLTTDQVRNRTKTVTRRLGWKFLQPGDIVNAVKKGMGLKKGEKVEVLGQIKVVRCNRMILNNQFEFKVIAQLWVNAQAELLGSSVELRVGENLDEDKYIEETGLPATPGVNAITNTLIQGLLFNLHDAHQRGLYDSAAHLRYIMAELESGFIRIAEFKEENWN